MNIEVLTTFPEMYASIMGNSIMKRAQDKGILTFKEHNLRDWTHDLHKTTDDSPYGGGSGLVMKCEPVFEAFDEIVGLKAQKPHVIIMAPQGKVFNDSMAQKLSDLNDILFICGHYEGLDQRIYNLADDVISIGDYVLTGGELASMVVIDSVVRKIPGVLGADDGAINESFADGLLEHPQYTRPAEFRGMNVPEVLKSGDHAKISKWKHQQSLLVTLKNRPDLLEGYNLSNEDRDFLSKL